MTAPTTTLKSLPDEEEDKPIPGVVLAKLNPSGTLALPELVFGAATFSTQYNSEDLLNSNGPARTLRLAFRYGINAIDTSVFYGDSEVILGHSLQAIKDEFPRESYKIMTKCGRYGRWDFDYTPSNIRDSVKRSLSRLQTDYLDTVYLHDVEFVATPVAAKTSGDHATALGVDAAAYGLADGDEATIRGEGDQIILGAFAELQKLKEEGLVKQIGITGYPLPVLLRLALLILHNPPFKPIDIMLSYSHISLQNDTLTQFAPVLQSKAKVKTILAASPFSMGLITPSGPPEWHPAPAELRKAISDSKKVANRGLADIALGYSIRKSKDLGLPLVAGLSSMKEVHELVKAWKELKEGVAAAERLKDEEAVRKVIEEAGFLDWSWASPGPK